jgi:hypothetical protein
MRLPVARRQPEARCSSGGAARPPRRVGGESTPGGTPRPRPAPAVARHPTMAPPARPWPPAPRRIVPSGLAESVAGLSQKAIVVLCALLRLTSNARPRASLRSARVYTLAVPCVDQQRADPSVTLQTTVTQDAGTRTALKQLLGAPHSMAIAASSPFFFGKHIYRSSNLNGTRPNSP